ncbi:MAG: hypothetical protein B7Z66_12020 [Chromatiales bacterium 21-64-14]|nr:MAG: hypothetical protein B7Z66_12020 [Chromatiales bacterium 21-64-14]
MDPGLIRHPLAVHTLYAELQQACFDAQAQEPTGRPFDAVGAVSAMSKHIRGRTYWYAQYLDAVGRRRQVYLGPQGDGTPQGDGPTERTVARLTDPERVGMLEHRRSLVRTLRSAGFTTLDATASRALTFLERVRLFRAGAAVVGTPAYHALLAQQGFSERVPVQTEDFGIQVDRLALALPGPAALAALARDWHPDAFPVPTMNRKSAFASLKIRGHTFRLDFLIAGHIGNTGRVVAIPQLNFGAQALAFLDYLTADAQPGLILSSTGTIAPLPQPGRFVWHKCAVAAARPPAWAAKRAKDLRQARTLFAVLQETDPDQLLEAAAQIDTAREGAALRARVIKTLQAEELSALRECLEQASSSRRAGPR